MKRFLALVLTVGMLCGALAGCGETGGVPTTDNSSAGPATTGGEESHMATPDAAKSNIAVNTQKTEDGMLCVFLTNNNDFVVDELDVKAIYKDDSGQTIDMAEDGHDMVLPGATVVSRLDTPTQYSSVSPEIALELGCYPNYQNHSQDVELNANKGEDCVIVEITNNAAVKIEEIEYAVVLYRGDALVSVTRPTDVRDVEAGSTITEKASTYGLEYDKFEVYLNQAHTFGI